MSLKSSISYNRPLMRKLMGAPSKQQLKSARSRLKPAARRSVLAPSPYPERKVQNTFFNSTITSGGTGALFNGLQPGTDIINRIGRQVTNVSIYQRITAQANPNSGSNQYIRFILFWVKEADGLAPTLLSVFGTATPGINQMLNLDNRNDYVVLKDMTIPLGTVTGSNSCRFYKIYKKCNVRTVYNAGVAGTIADIESGALYMLAFSDTVGANQIPTLTIQSRVRFCDN